MSYTTFGPGTVTVTVDGGGGTALDFSCEVKSARVLHTYEEVGEARTMLCGEKRNTSEVRADGIGLSLENDFGAGGLYTYLIANDLKPATVVYTPNTSDGASWSIAGVALRLPEEVAADEFGAPLASEVEWGGGVMTFTESTEPVA